MILSYHPCYTADRNRLCAGRDPDEKDIDLMRSAGAVILPQGCRPALYKAARASCSNVFPDYDARFRWPDKTGQIRMFRYYGAPHPRSRIFDTLGDYTKTCGAGAMPEDFEFPFVFKYNGPGEGAGVWKVETRKQMEARLRQTASWEKTGQYGFLIQQYIDTGGLCLRVAVDGRTLVSYWRVDSSPEKFHVSAAGGAAVDRDAFPGLRLEAEKHVQRLCADTGINLGGFDLIFPRAGGGPLFLEVNYYFGRRGLGGSEKFYSLLCREIDRWVSERLR